MGVASGCGEQEVGVASGSGWSLCTSCRAIFRGGRVSSLAEKLIHHKYTCKVNTS